MSRSALLMATRTVSPVSAAVTGGAAAAANGTKAKKIDTRIWPSIELSTDRPDIAADIRNSKPNVGTHISFTPVDQRSV